MKLWMSLSRHMKLLLTGLAVFFVLLIPPVRSNLLLVTTTKMTFHTAAISRLGRDSAPPFVFSRHQNSALFTLLRSPEEWFGIHYSGVGAMCDIEVESLGFIHWSLGYDPIEGHFLDGGPAAKLCPQAQVALNRQLGYERFTPPSTIRAAQNSSR